MQMLLLGLLECVGYIGLIILFALIILLIFSI